MKLLDYEQFLELANVTLEDCRELYDYKNIETIINDGRIITFIKSE